MPGLGCPVAVGIGTVEGEVEDAIKDHNKIRDAIGRADEAKVGSDEWWQAVTDADFDSVVLRSDKPVVVDYWADWCGPCKQVAPIIEELATQHGDKVTFVKMDTNTNPVTPANNHVLGLPTIQVYVGGELVKAFKGAKSKSTLLNALEEYL